MFVLLVQVLVSYKMWYSGCFMVKHLSCHDVSPHKYRSIHFLPHNLHSRTRTDFIFEHFESELSPTTFLSNVILKRGSGATIPVSDWKCLPCYRATNLIPGHICLCRIILQWKNRDLATKLSYVWKQHTLWGNAGKGNHTCLFAQLHENSCKNEMMWPSSFLL